MPAAVEDTNAEVIRPDMAIDPPLTALVLSGGLGLGAYHGGAFEAFTSLSLSAGWVAGSSAGAISAALIAEALRPTGFQTCATIGEHRTA